MVGKLLFSVCEGYDGTVAVHSYGGTTKAEERKFAAGANRRVLLVTADFNEACRHSRGLKAAQQAARHPSGCSCGSTDCPEWQAAQQGS